MKATEQYFPVVLFIMLYKVVLIFESVDEILQGDHTNERNWTVLSHSEVSDVFFVVPPVFVCARQESDRLKLLLVLQYLQDAIWKYILRS